MLTEIQTVILTCLLGPEDKKAWRREGLYVAARERRRKRQERTPKKDKKWTPEFVSGYLKNYREKHRETLLEKRREYIRLRLRTNPEFRLRHYLRSRLWRPLLGRAKSAKTLELLGCSISELRSHLESKFKPGMSWENYGPIWHVDHIKPIISFDLTDPEQQRLCCHWSNLQPLFAADNISKGGRV